MGPDGAVSSSDDQDWLSSGDEYDVAEGADGVGGGAGGSAGGSSRALVSWSAKAGARGRTEPAGVRCVCCCKESAPPLPPPRKFSHSFPCALFDLNLTSIPVHRPPPPHTHLTSLVLAPLPILPLRSALAASVGAPTGGGGGEWQAVLTDMQERLLDLKMQLSVAQQRYAAERVVRERVEGERDAARAALAALQAGLEADRAACDATVRAAREMVCGAPVVCVCSCWAPPDAARRGLTRDGLCVTGCVAPRRWRWRLLPPRPGLPSWSRSCLRSFGCCACTTVLRCVRVFTCLPLFAHPCARCPLILSPTRPPHWRKMIVEPAPVPRPASTPSLPQPSSPSNFALPPQRKLARVNGFHTPPPRIPLSFLATAQNLRVEGWRRHVARVDAAQAQAQAPAAAPALHPHTAREARDVGGSGAPKEATVPHSLPRPVRASRTGSPGPDSGQRASAAAAAAAVAGGGGPRGGGGGGGGAPRERAGSREQAGSRERPGSRGPSPGLAGAPAGGSGEGDDPLDPPQFVGARVPFEREPAQRV